MAEETKVREHQWTQVTLTPVEVVGLHADGEPALFATAEGEVKAFCMLCHIGLTDMAVGTECPGYDEDENEVQPEC